MRDPIVLKVIGRNVRFGQKQTSRPVRVMSVIPPKADIHQRGFYDRLVPLTDIREGPTTCRPILAVPGISVGRYRDQNSLF